MPAPALALAPAAMRVLQGIMAAAKNAPRSAPKGGPAMLKPTTPTNPLNTVVRDPSTGQMVSTMGYSPAQLAASRLAVGAPVVAGAAAAPSFFPERAEGDPVAAMSRRNESSDPGRENYDALYRSLEAQNPVNPNMAGFKDLPGYEGEGLPRAMPTPATDPGRGDYDALFRSLIEKSRPAPSRDAAPAAAAAEPSLRDRLFGGQDFQSNNQAVVSRPQGPMSDGAPQRATLNFGDSGSAADFFRADKAMQGLLRDKEEFVGMASGGAANGSSNKAAGSGRDAAIYKALEIIHHMMVNR